MSYKEAAKQFAKEGEIKKIEPYGNGNINHTFLVSLQSGPIKHFILQQLNNRVFKHPHRIANNIQHVNDHISKRLPHFKPLEGRRWLMPQVLKTINGQQLWQAEDSNWWRALSFIEDAETHQTITTQEQAQEVGFGLGTFHALLNDLPEGKLTTTLEYFHVTPQYYKYYRAIDHKTQSNRSPEVDFCKKFISKRSGQIHVLEDAKNKGLLKTRPIHGDPKINNIMMDSFNGQAISIIDLDTIMPGLVHYDIGDCLRSGCNISGEESNDLQSVSFNLELCNSILKGYSIVAQEFLGAHDYDYIYDAVWLISFELGLRYFTDYLAGNMYFRTEYPEHNLARARIQFQLTDSIEKQEYKIRSITKNLS